MRRMTPPLSSLIQLHCCRSSSQQHASWSLPSMSSLGPSRSCRGSCSSLGTCSQRRDPQGLVQKAQLPRQRCRSCLVPVASLAAELLLDCDHLRSGVACSSVGTKVVEQLTMVDRRKFYSIGNT